MYATATAEPTGGSDIGTLRELTKLWITAIDCGIEKKERVYGRGAAECKKFYLGDHGYIFDSAKAKLDEQLYLTVGVEGAFNEKPVRIPRFQIADNWAAKLVQILAPYLTQGELIRTVMAAKMFQPSPAIFGVDPMQVMQFKLQMYEAQGGKDLMRQYAMQQQQANMQMQMAMMQQMTETELRKGRSDLVEKMINYTQKELGLSRKRREIIEEALVLGFGGYLTELINMPGANQRLVTSTYILAEDIIWDPDVMQENDAKWLAIRCREPAWVFASKYQVAEEEIKADLSTSTGEQMRKSLIIESGSERNVLSEKKGDTVEYYKVWSRMGTGARFQPVDSRNPTLIGLDQYLGDYCFFIVTKALDYPANLSPAVLDQVSTGMHTAMMNKAMGYPAQDPREILKLQTNHPTPFYLDPDDPWPLTVQGFHRRNGSPYYIPHLQYSLSYLKFMVWCISFIADKCYRAQRDIIIMDATIAKQLREAIENGDDEAIVELKGTDEKTLEQFVKILAMPELKTSIVEIYQFFENKVEQMTGLSDLMQAQMSRQMRTATEAKVISDASMLRPNDMLAKVNAVDTRVARKEAIASIIHYQPTDIAPALGGVAANAWQTLFSQRDPVTTIRESDYTVVAGPGKILDLATRQQNAQTMMQLFMPFIGQMAMATGNMSGVRAIKDEVAKAYQIDPDLIELPDLPPPPPPEEGGQRKGVASPPNPKGKSKGPD